MNVKHSVPIIVETISVNLKVFVLLVKMDLDSINQIKTVKNVKEVIIIYK